MNKLIKPQKQSYTGEDSQVVAYSVICEVASAFKTCAISFGVAALVSWHPFFAGATVVCASGYVHSSWACSLI